MPARDKARAAASSRERRGCEPRLMFFLLRKREHFSARLVAERPGIDSRNWISCRGRVHLILQSVPNVSFRALFLFLSIAFQRSRIVIDLGRRRFYFGRPVVRDSGIAGAGKNRAWAGTHATRNLAA